MWMVDRGSELVPCLGRKARSKEPIVPLVGRLAGKWLVGQKIVIWNGVD